MTADLRVVFMKLGQDTQAGDGEGRPGGRERTQPGLPHGGWLINDLKTPFPSGQCQPRSLGWSDRPPRFRALSDRGPHVSGNSVLLTWKGGFVPHVAKQLTWVRRQTDVYTKIPAAAFAWMGGTESHRIIEPQRRHYQLGEKPLQNSVHTYFTFEYTRTCTFVNLQWGAYGWDTFIICLSNTLMANERH